MTVTYPYLPGTLFLFDTSVLARRAQPVVRDSVLQAVDDGVAATCATIDLELGFSARTTSELHDMMQVRQEAFVSLPISESMAARAKQVQLLMARRGLHRGAGVMDLLTAAVAEHHRAIVVHYDNDFELIASVTGQQTVWVVPRGSLD